MVRCRCADIRRINLDIDDLESARTRLGRISDRNSDKQHVLAKLANSVTNTFFPTPTSGIATEIRNLNRDISSANSDIRAAIRTRISDLEGRRRTLRQQDNQFHANQSGSWGSHRW